MRQTRPWISPVRTHAALASRGLFAVMLFISAGAASCATQGYYESQVAARTAYEAAESAKAAAYASTVAALDMHEANLRATRAMHELTGVLTGSARQSAPSRGGTGQTGVPGAPTATDAHTPGMSVTGGQAEQAAGEPLMQTIKVLAPAVPQDNPATTAPAATTSNAPPSNAQEDASGVLPLIRQTNATLERVIASQDRLAQATDKVGAAADKISVATDKLVTQTDIVTTSTDRLATRAELLASKSDRVAMSADVLAARMNEERERPAPMPLPMTDVKEENRRTLALAFASFAIVSMLGVGWWTERTRRASRDARDDGDWLLVSSASGAAVTSIGLIGALYFAVRIFQSQPQDNPLWNMPWQTMAWLWASMVIVGLAGMWVMALVAFWTRLSDVDHARRAKDAVAGVPSTRHEMWRLWIAVLVVGLLPALGMLAMARADLLLDMFLVLVFAVFAGAAMLLSGREEVVSSQPARHAST